MWHPDFTTKNWVIFHKGLVSREQYPTLLNTEAESSTGPGEDEEEDEKDNHITNQNCNFSRSDVLSISKSPI